MISEKSGDSIALLNIIQFPQIQTLETPQFVKFPASQPTPTHSRRRFSASGRSSSRP